MKKKPSYLRDTANASKKKYDIIIIGGGIYGATLLWESTLRGLSAILIERNDFCSATSANSLKIIHGGLRYLQNLDLKRVRESSKELQILMKIAPHLVHPLSCVIPTHPQIKRSKLAFLLAFKLYDLIGINVNRKYGFGNEILPGKVIHLNELLDKVPSLDSSDITGGALWYDALNYNSERLVLAFILSAIQRGAEAFNYMEMRNLIIHRNRVIGVQAIDKLLGQEFELFGKVVVNTTGPWIDKLNQQMKFNPNKSQPHFAKAVNLIIPRLLSEYAFGLKTNGVTDNLYQTNRYIFFVPWRDSTMIGTWYFWQNYPLNDDTLVEEEFNICINQIQQALPSANVVGDEICFVHLGFIPVVPNFHNNSFELEKYNSLIDHSQYGGPDGIFSVLGIKYTTARSVAAKTINFISRKIGKSIHSSSFKMDHLIGGDIESIDKLLRAKKKSNDCQLSERTIKHLVLNYGTKYDEIVELIFANNELGELVPGSDEAIKAELLYCIENEYAYNLSDLVLRRTDIGSLKKPNEETINFCGSFMGKEIGWSESEKQDQINSLLKYYDRHSIN